MIATNKLEKQHIILDLLLSIFMLLFFIKPVFLKLTAIEGLAILLIIILTCLFKKKFVGLTEPIIYFILIIIFSLLATIYNPIDFNIKTFLSCEFIYDIWPLLLLMVLKIFTEKDIKYVSFIGTVLITITLISTYNGLQKYPEASRLLAGWATQTQKNLYYGLNIGGYEFIYGCIFFFPIIFYISIKYVRKKICKIVLIMLSIFAISVIIKAQYSIALFLVIANFALLSIPKNSTRKILYIFLILIGIVILVFFFDNILDLLLDTFTKHNLVSVTNRINAFKNALFYEGIGNFDRMRLYSKSLKVILDYPIIGGMWFPHIDYSKHSGALDLFAQYGVFSFVWIMYFVSCYRKIMKYYIHSEVKNIYRSIMIVYIVFIILNMFNIYVDISIVVFFIIPLILKILDNYLSECKEEK